MIYFVEDDASIRELVLYTLNNAGLQAEGFERPSAFWAAMEQVRPTLILLDIMLPEEDGLSILRKLRADRATRALPVMMLTAKGTEYDTVLALDAGADDYVPQALSHDGASLPHSCLDWAGRGVQHPSSIGGVPHRRVRTVPLPAFGPGEREGDCTDLQRI